MSASRVDALLRKIVIAVAALVIVAPGLGAQETSADRVFRGGRVMTLDAAGTIAEAVAVADGRILWVGPETGIDAWIGAGTEVVDLEGRLLLPGFQDAHVHTLMGGVELGECDLNGLEEAAEILERVRACATALPGDAWVRGGGFPLTVFPNGNPRAADLDAVTGGRPAYLTSSDGHSAWVNSRALELAGIDRDTPDPPAGRIERDPETGEATGTLRETAAFAITELLPPYTAEQLDEGLRRGLRVAASYGITAFKEASATAAAVRSYARLARAGELTAKVSVSQYVDVDRGVAQLPDLMRIRSRYSGLPRLTVNGAKIFADGVLEAWTGALIDPYVGRGDDRGEPNLDGVEMIELVTALDAARFQVHVHAIGDRAIRDALDAFEAARRVNGAWDSRHHIVHAQLIQPSDLPRFARLGVFANFSPLWAYADMFITELTDPYLGPERAQWQYPIGELIRGGAEVVFGSDWTVSSMDPLMGIEVGVTRTDPEAADLDPWLPEQRATVEQMLRGYTSTAARVNFLEDTTGSIEIGKAADLIVVDRDLTAISPLRISEARVLITLVDGEVVYRAG